MDSRKPSCSRSEEVEIRKGPWTMEEDLILINYIATHGEGVWNSLAKAAGLKRTGKSCRLRWLNYLRPDVRRGNITPEEQILIMDLHAKWGNRWSKIAKHLPGRTDNEIKNFWRTRIQKQLKQGNMNEQSSPGQSYEQAGQSTSQLSSSGTTGLSLAAAHDPYSASSYAEPMSSGYHMLPPHNGHAPVPALPSHHQMGVADSTDHYWPMEADLWNSMAFFSGEQGRLT